MQLPALFLHTAFRSAGTWVWQRFREQHDVMAFCEPLNPWLAGVTSETLLESRPDTWPSRHPVMRPYFAEYAPLVKKRGVAGYDRRFAHHDYFAPASKRMPALHSYLRSLCEFAHSEAKIPVLKFTRSLGRVEWMRRVFPEAAHVVVLRSPFAQYRSCARLFAEGHRDFLALPIALLASSQQDPVVRSALSALECNVRPIRRVTFDRTFRAAERFVEQTGPDEIYRAWLAFWLATALKSLPFAELVIDTGHLYESSSYRHYVERRLAELSGVEISLEDVAPQSRDDIGVFAPSSNAIRTLHATAQAMCTGFEMQGDDLIAAG